MHRYFSKKPRSVVAALLAITVTAAVADHANGANNTPDVIEEAKQALPHPFITRTKSGAINKECFETGVLQKLRALKLPPDYIEQRMWRLYPLKPSETEFVEKLATKLVGKSQGEIARLLGDPEITTGAEGYGAPTREFSSHWVYFLGFEVVMLDLTFYNNKCVAATTESNLDNMFRTAKKYENYIRKLAIGKSREEVLTNVNAADFFELLNNNNSIPKFQYAHSLVQLQHREELAQSTTILPNDRSLYLDTMRRTTLELTFRDNKCTGAEYWFEVH